MMLKNKDVELLVELAMESEIADPIDWGDLNISEEEAYRLMAMHVLEMKNDKITADAIITKLLVENFVLNMKLLGKQ